MAHLMAGQLKGKIVQLDGKTVEVGGANPEDGYADVAVRGAGGELAFYKRTTGNVTVSDAPAEKPAETVAPAEPENHQ